MNATGSTKAVGEYPKVLYANFHALYDALEEIAARRQPHRDDQERPAVKLDTPTMVIRGK